MKILNKNKFQFHIIYKLKIYLTLIIIKFKFVKNIFLKIFMKKQL